MLASGIAVWGTIQGWGPYGVGAVGERLTLLQIFMGIVAGTGLLLGAAVSERDEAGRRRRAEHVITQVLSEASDANAAVLRILEVICLHLEWEAGLFWSLDRESQHLRCTTIWRQPTSTISEFDRISRARSFGVGNGLPGRVWASNAPSWLIEVPNDPAYPRLEAAAAEGLHGAFACPVTVGGDLLGVLEFFYRRPIQQPDNDLLQMFSTIGPRSGSFSPENRWSRRSPKAKLARPAFSKPYSTASSRSIIGDESSNSIRRRSRRSATADRRCSAARWPT